MLCPPQLELFMSLLGTEPGPTERVVHSLQYPVCASQGPGQLLESNQRGMPCLKEDTHRGTWSWFVLRARASPSPGLMKGLSQVLLILSSPPANRVPVLIWLSFTGE